MDTSTVSATLSRGNVIWKLIVASPLAALTAAA
jgi:hypothetical protein